MDYGQLAYVKAEEIEAYLRKAAQAEERRTHTCAAFYPRTALESGYAPCTVFGSGNVGLTAVLRLAAPQGADNITVRLYCGEHPAAYTRITLPAGGRENATLFASVYPGAGERIRIEADAQGLLLEELRVSVEGAGASVSGGQEGYKCDCSATAIYTARTEADGYVYVRKYGTDRRANVLHGGVFDIAVRGDTVAVAGSDDDGNLWGVTLDADLKETRRVRLGAGADSVALGQSPAGWILATTQNRKVFLAECEPDFGGLSAFAPADFVTEADEVFFCKQSENPVLFLRRGGNVFAKLPVSCVTAGVELNVALSVGVPQA